MNASSHMGHSISEPLATVMVGVHHSAYVENGAVTGDPTLVPGYDADEPERPGTLLMVVDHEGWGTLHRVLARDSTARKIEFGERIPWPDGSIAARRLGHDA